MGPDYVEECNKYETLDWRISIATSRPAEKKSDCVSCCENNAFAIQKRCTKCTKSSFSAVQPKRVGIEMHRSFATKSGLKRNKKFSEHSVSCSSSSSDSASQVTWVRKMTIASMFPASKYGICIVRYKAFYLLRRIKIRFDLMVRMFTLSSHSEDTINGSYSVQPYLLVEGSGNNWIGFFFFET